MKERMVQLGGPAHCLLSAEPGIKRAANES